MLTPVWKFMVLALAGWMNRQQQEAIEYLQTENRILREKLGQKRIRLNDSQKARLGEAAAKLGRALLQTLGALFSPDTLLPGHSSPRTLFSAGTAGSSLASTTARIGAANADLSPRRPTPSASW
jgi:hypothetical protein